MKLATILEDRTALLDLQQQLIDKLPDEYDIALDTFARCEVVTVTSGNVTCMLMNTPADLRAHRDAGLLWGRDVAGRVSVLTGKKNYPINTHSLSKVELHGKLGLNPWTSFSGIDITLNVIGSFLKQGEQKGLRLPEGLTESRSELLHLQQRLIDDLPDAIEVELTHQRLLGDVVCVIITKDGYPSKRFLKPSNKANYVSYVTNEYMPWSDYSYDGIVRLILKAALP
jgi:hypothetical protein